MPVQVTAHHPQIFGGYILMEQSQMGSKLIDPKLKALAELRVARLVGCPFCMDIGCAAGRAHGLAAEQIANLNNYRSDFNFSDLEHSVFWTVEENGDANAAGAFQNASAACTKT
jgi:AhpD family alkylhydroperoxidase